jgi:hypothetical protein
VCYGKKAKDVVRLPFEPSRNHNHTEGSEEIGHVTLGSVQPSQQSNENQTTILIHTKKY